VRLLRWITADEGQDLMIRADIAKSFLADLARPFALYSVAASTAFAIVRLSWSADDLSAAAVFITAALGGLAALYGAKAWENAKQGQHTASVETAKASATPQAATTTITAAPDVEVTVREAAHDGELPPEQRVAL